MRQDTDQLALIQTLEVGLPYASQARWATSWGLDWLEGAVGWSDRIFGQVSSKPGTLTYTQPEAVGVAGVITTWNGSVGAFGMSVAPALAAGCTVVVKPSVLAPFGPLRCAELLLEAGVPPGVLNVVPGDAEAGKALVAHSDVAKISFTGSRATGRQISALCAESLKPCVLELGGKSASLIFEDADVEAALNAITSVSANAGQQCTLASRLIIHRSVYSDLMEGATERLKGIKVGDPMDPTVTMGPVASAQACQRILGYVENARDTGCVRTGGERLGGDLAGGYFLAPTLIDGVAHSSALAQEEVFGPVLTAFAFSDEDEAIALANDTTYGLAAYVHTKDLARAHRVAARLDAQGVGINGGGVPSDPEMPFGGRGGSGHGAEGGLAGVLEFVNMKTIQVKF